MAQEAVVFGDWRVFCAPVAGCALGTRTEEGDRLALSEPLSNDDLMLFFPTVPMIPQSKIVVRLDDQMAVTLEPETGWQSYQMDRKSGAQIDPTIAKNALILQMRRPDVMQIEYLTAAGKQRVVRFSLRGYADTRAYVDDP